MNFAAFLSTHQWIIILAAIWTIPWKGVALWRAARNRSIAWFVILLIVNTLGILEIIYIFAFSKKTETKVEVSKKLEESQETPETEKIFLEIKKEEQAEKKGEERKEEAKSDLDEHVPTS